MGSRAIWKPRKLAGRSTRLTCPRSDSKTKKNQLRSNTNSKRSHSNAFFLHRVVLFYTRLLLLFSPPFLYLSPNLFFACFDIYKKLSISVVRWIQWGESIHFQQFYEIFENKRFFLDIFRKIILSKAMIQGMKEFLVSSRSTTC